MVAELINFEVFPTSILTVVGRDMVVLYSRGREDVHVLIQMQEGIACPYRACPARRVVLLNGTLLVVRMAE